jgi:hypothetical protein
MAYVHDKLPRIPFIAATVACIVHLVANPHYGFYGDELYFIICGRHPALGYVDQPPLTPLVSAATQALGPSLFLLRAVPALCAGVSVYVASIFASEIGGGVFAQLLAAGATALSPVLLSLGARSSPDMFEIWLWPLIALLVVRMIKGADLRLWLWVGALVALAAWSKYSIGFFVIGLVAGLLASSQRRVLRTPWFAMGAALAALLILPDFLWQVQNGFPMLQVLHNDYGRGVINAPFLWQQIMVMHPVLSVLWFAGLVWLLCQQQLRWLAYAYLIVIVAMAALDAKLYYPAAIYPYMFAAGAVAVERVTAARSRLRPALALGIVATVLPVVPFTLPILPMPQYVKFQNFFHREFGISFSMPGDHRPNVPMQLYADMTGWPQMVSTVARVYRSLPRGEQKDAVIYTRDFLEASAVNFYGRRFGLPEAVSGNNNYWLWGPGSRSGQTFIDVNGDPKRDGKFFADVREVGVFRNPYGMPYETNIPIFVCRGLKSQLAQIWPRFKHYGYAMSPDPMSFNPLAPRAQ